MRIFTKKAFKLEANGKTFVTKPLTFDDIPKEFSKCLLFQWGVKDGDIEIVGDNGKQKALENNPGRPTAARKPKPPEEAGDTVKPPTETGDAE